MLIPLRRDEELNDGRIGFTDISILKALHPVLSAPTTRMVKFMSTMHIDGSPKQ